jgi:hypothetical protein
VVFYLCSTYFAGLSFGLILPNNYILSFFFGQLAFLLFNQSKEQKNIGHFLQIVHDDCGR